MTERDGWKLYGGYAPTPVEDPGRAWLRELAASHPHLGEGEFIELPGVSCGSHVAAIVDGYVERNSVVLAFFLPNGTYTLAILDRHATCITPQPQLRLPECINAFSLPLHVAAPTCEDELNVMAARAYALLIQEGVLS
jgi:hypothetical protein